MITTIHLHGRAGKMFGRVWRFDVNNVAEALRCIFRARPSSVSYFESAERNGTVFRVVDKEGRPVRNLEELALTNTDELHVHPIVQGSKRAGVLQTIIGAVLVIVGAILVITGYGAPVGKFLIMMGASMMLGGIIQMLTPIPKTDKVNAENNDSYLINGNNMASRQGRAIPIGYGKMHVGGMLVSASVYAERMAVGSGTGLGGGGAGGSDGPYDPIYGDGFYDSPIIERPYIDWNEYNDTDQFDRNPNDWWGSDDWNPWQSWGPEQNSDYFGSADMIGS